MNFELQNFGLDDQFVLTFLSIQVSEFDLVVKVLIQKVDRIDEDVTTMREYLKELLAEVKLFGNDVLI